MMLFFMKEIQLALAREEFFFCQPNKTLEQPVLKLQS